MLIPLTPLYSIFQMKSHRLLNIQHFSYKTANSGIGIRIVTTIHSLEAQLHLDNNELKNLQPFVLVLFLIVARNFKTFISKKAKVVRGFSSL